MKKRVLAGILSLILILCLLPAGAQAAEGDVMINAANFPDAAFRTFVREGYDVNGDGVLSQAEIAAATTMDCSDMGIASLGGIEFFTAIRELNCNRNQLTSLNLYNNTEMRVLYCLFNDLAFLNVSTCAKLWFLWCDYNDLTSLNVRNNPNLASLSCNDNRLTSLDISCNPNLYTLYSHGNLLTSLDLSQTPLLRDTLLYGTREELLSDGGLYTYYSYTYKPSSLTHRLTVDIDVNLVTTARYDVWVQGRRVTSDNMDDVLGNGAVSYTPAAGDATAKLTLNNAAIAGAAGHGSYTQDEYGIEAWEPIELALIGENTVISGNASRRSVGIFCAGKLTVSGSGKLTAISGTGGSGYSSGIRAYGDFTVNGGQITASGREAGADNISTGIYTNGDMVINGGAVYMGGDVNDSSYGAHAYGSIVIKGGTVTASGGRRAFVKNPDLSGYPNADVLVNTAASSSGRRPWNGTDPLGGNGSSFKYVYIEPAVYYDVWVQGRRVTYRNQIDVLGDGGSVVFDHTESTLTLTDAHITGAPEPGHPNDSAGIFHATPLTLKLVGENTVSSSDTSGHSNAIDGTDFDLTITGTGSLTATGGKSSERSSYGIYTEGEVTIDSGAVTASGSDGHISLGIYGASGVTINGGTVTAIGGVARAGSSEGVSTEVYPVVITGGEVTAIGNTRGFDQEPDLSALPTSTVLVNTSPTATGATEWNGTDALGYGSPFKYVSVLPYGTIRSVAVSGFVAPVAGHTAISGYDLAVPEGAPYSVNRISWHDAETWQYIRPPFQFEEGRSYYAVIVLYSSTGYVFPGVGTTGYSQFDSFTLNGGTALISAPDTEVVSNRECYMLTVDMAALSASAMILVGDVNGDGSVTNADAALLKRYIAGWSVSIDRNAADLNRDGSVTNADAALLNRYIAGWAGYDRYIIQVPASP